MANDSRKSTTTGEILNLMQIDTQSLVDWSMHAHLIWSSPLLLLLSTVILWFYIKWAIFAALGVFLLIIPYNLFSSSQINKIQENLIDFKDKRIKMINEILNGIKVLKFYGIIYIILSIVLLLNKIGYLI